MSGERIGNGLSGQSPEPNTVQYHDAQCQLGLAHSVASMLYGNPSSLDNQALDLSMGPGSPHGSTADTQSRSSSGSTSNSSTEEQFPWFTKTKLAKSREGFQGQSPKHDDLPLDLSVRPRSPYCSKTGLQSRPSNSSNSLNPSLRSPKIRSTGKPAKRSEQTKTVYSRGRHSGQGPEHVTFQHNDAKGQPELSTAVGARLDGGGNHSPSASADRPLDLSMRPRSPQGTETGLQSRPSSSSGSASNASTPEQSPRPPKIRTNIIPGKRPEPKKSRQEVSPQSSTLPVTINVLLPSDDGSGSSSKSLN